MGFVPEKLNQSLRDLTKPEVVLNACSLNTQGMEAGGFLPYCSVGSF